MADDLTISEPYNDTNVKNRTEGYTPVSPVKSAYESMLGEGAKIDIASDMKQIKAERNEKAYADASKESALTRSYYAQKKQLKDKAYAIQMHNAQREMQMAIMRRQDMEARLRQNGFLFGNSNVDEEASVSVMAQELGISEDAVRGDIEGAKSRIGAERLAQLAEKNPKLAQFFTNPQNVAKAHDDTENMSALEQAWNIGVDSVRGLVAGVVESPKTLVGLVNQYAHAAPQAAEMESLSFNPEAISSDEYMGRLESAEAEGANSVIGQASKKAYKGISDVGDYIQGDRWQNYGIIGRGLVSGARSLGNQILPFKGAKLFSAMPLVIGGLAENTSSFMEDIDHGRGYGTAASHGLWNGSIEALTEKIPMGGWMADSAKAMPFWKKLARGWARETPTELLATTFQNLGDVSAETAGKNFGDFISGNMDSGKYGKMFAKYWHDLPTALAETAVSVFPMSLGFAGLSYHRQSQAAEQGRRAIDAINDAGQKSKLLKRDSETYKALARTLKEGTSIQEVGIEKSAWDKYFQDSGYDPEAEAKRYGIENYNEAEASDHLAMPSENYVSDFVKDGHVPALADFTTLANGQTMTLNESIQYGKEVEQQAARELEAIKKGEASNSEWVHVNNVISNLQKEIKYQLEGTGMTSRAAEIQSQLGARFMTTTLVRDAIQSAVEQGKEVNPREVAKYIRDAIYGKDFRITRGQQQVRKNVEPWLDSLIEDLRKGNPNKMARQAYGETLTQFVRRNGGLIPNEDLKTKVRNKELPSSIISKKSKNGADTMALLAKQAGYMLDDQTRNIDDDLIERLMEEHQGGSTMYSVANRNDELAARIAILDSLNTDLGIAGIDLNETTNNEEVRKLLAEFDGERYGRKDSTELPEAEEGQSERLEQRGFTENENATPEEIDEANRQYDEVVAKYKDTDQWLKAPNGKDTNLNERQWVQVRTENFKKWAGDWENEPANATKVLDENGEPKVVYHGTSRADRVADVFRADRATSGPMAFFTDDKGIADNYARDKKDTSLSRDDMDDVRNWFQYTDKKGNVIKNISDVWDTLTAREKSKIAKNAPTVTMDDDWENVVINKKANGLGNYDWSLKESNGNVIEALFKEWYESASIMGDERKFMDVMKLAGLDTSRVQFMDPEYREEKTYAVFMRMNSPLNTTAMSADLVKAIEERAETEEEKYEPSEGYAADSWDKSNVSPLEWLDKFKDDIANGTTYSWTRIPDWVTDVLKEHGYDGIQDAGIDILPSLKQGDSY